MVIASAVVWSYIIVLLLPTLWPFVILLVRDNAKWKNVFFPPTGLLAAMLKLKLPLGIVCSRIDNAIFV